MENTRKRTEREIADARQFGLTGFAKDLIEVMENLHRAVANLPEVSDNESDVIKNMRVGLDMTLKELQSVFSKQNITRVHPFGDPFNHDLHQAVSQVEGTDQPANTVVDVMQAGYLLNGRLLRPAMVAVSK